MKCWGGSLTSGLLACTLATPGFAQEADPVHPFSRIGSNTLESLAGTNAILHAASVSSTMVLVATDVDYEVQGHSPDHREYDPYPLPAVYGGYAVPVLLGGGLCLAGAAGADATTTGPTCTGSRTWWRGRSWAWQSSCAKEA